MDARFAKPLESYVLEGIACRVKIALAVRGMSIGDLASKARISPTTLSGCLAGGRHWATGQSRRTECRLVRVAKVFDIPVQALMPPIRGKLPDLQLVLQLVAPLTTGEL